MLENEHKPARDKALAILARRAHSTGELSDKLEEYGYIPEDCEDAVGWLADLGYLDDAAYGHDCAEELAAKGYGSFRIRRELQARRLDRELVEEILSELPEPSEAIDNLIAHMSAGRSMDDPGQRRRLANALYRRGFSWDDINEGLERNML